jgi:translation initiation factor 1
VKKPAATPSSPFGTLADALAARGFTRPAEAPAAAREPVDVEVEPPAPAGGKVVVRRETKGRRGKTVTTVQGLSISSDARGELVRLFKTRLGTGATADGGQIVVQGDHVERVAALLEESGVTRVVRG